MEQDYTHIKDLLNLKEVGTVKSIRGWIWRIRSSGGVVFAIIRDSTGIIQVTVSKKNIDEKKYNEIEKALVESSIEVTGTLYEDKRAPNGLEIHVTNFNLVHKAENFPIFKDQNEAFLLDNRHLTIRSTDLTNIFKIKSTILKGAKKYFDDNLFFEVTPPIITGNACEGGATLFSFDYFGNKAYLSQSAQLYLESLIYSLENVWSITPSFRAEKSRTRRHLTEFWILEAEEAWTPLAKNIKIQEDLMTTICETVIKERANELEQLHRDIEILKNINPPFRKIKYEKAIQILSDKGFDIHWGDDFGAEEEHALTIDEQEPIFVTHYPAEIKAFYMKLSDDGKTVENADLLAPEGFGEIIGGSERSNDIEYMKKRLINENADVSKYDWYFDLRRFGNVTHSGFGVGVERVTRWIAKAEHIRDTIPYPRTTNRYTP
ncbi:MAG: asparagine--tRNA ligase [Candidatus Thermoplasmatota archaeon]|jgi:asparaginyl-tRNA synthetase|nr:asparagine--tRNA ligase [Candidatus Thermoplasmatota archaeon]MCL5964017.1 asparagine--tRNA ligase [Candidatus Thermoplasmatota archaeon]